MKAETIAKLTHQLRDRADEIDKAVARDKDDRDTGAFCEIELMRLAADAIDVLALSAEDMAILNAYRRRRALIAAVAASQKELAELDTILGPAEIPTT